MPDEEAKASGNDHPAPRRLSGAEPFHAAGASLDFAAVDFWRWAFSNLAGNSLRGLVAEYLVARALGLATGARVEWDAVDLKTDDGLRIEVKCSGYGQTWAQAKPSAITFDVAPKRGWDASTNVLSATSGRSAHVYVFCVHAHQDRATLDPLDVKQWEFYVVTRATLDEKLGTQSRAGLSTIRRLGAEASDFATLGTAIRAARPPT